MDFGKLPNIGRVDFRLPEAGTEPDTRSLLVLKAVGNEAAPVVRVGCPVWAERKWVGRVYPLGAQPSDFLHHYSRQFDTIELNATHYRIPTPESVLEWRRETPPEFRFCPKWPQEISHHRELLDCEPLTAMFCDSLSRLGDRLGTSFLQLSPGFAPNRLPLLKRFLERLPSKFPVCVEFRHADWFKDHQLIPSACDVLERLGAGTVITDVAGRRDAAHVSLTAPRALIRFVGNELDPTDTTRIEDWVPRLKLWLENGLQELYFCCHEPDNVLAPELAHIFIDRMNRLTSAGLRRWQAMDQGTQLGFGI